MDDVSQAPVFLSPADLTVANAPRPSTVQTEDDGMASAFMPSFGQKEAGR